MAYNICPLRFNHPGDKQCEQKYCSWWDDKLSWCAIWVIADRLATICKQMPGRGIGLSHDWLKGVGSEVLQDVMQELKDKQ